MKMFLRLFCMLILGQSIIIPVKKTYADIDIEINNTYQQIQDAHSDNKRIVVTYFDVGQGLCQLITYGNIIILSDCGSASGQAHLAVANGVGDIINNLLNNNDSKRLIIFVSHLDKDHYNLLPAVYARINLKSGNNGRITRFFHYGLAELQALRGNPLGFASDLGGPDSYSIYYEPNIRTSDVHDQFHMQVLDVNNGGVNADKNSRSIAFVVIDNQSGTALLSTGDIQSDSRIEGELRRIFAGVQYRPRFVYPAAHHGAYSFGTYNPFGLLNSLRPIITIFSAGRNMGYLHPRCNLINLIKERWQRNNWPNPENRLRNAQHRLDCGIAYYSSDRDIRAEMTTVYPMWNTCNSGHITITFPAVHGGQFHVRLERNNVCQ